MTREAVRRRVIAERIWQARAEVIREQLVVVRGTYPAAHA